MVRIEVCMYVPEEGDEIDEKGGNEDRSFGNKVSKKCSSRSSYVVDGSHSRQRMTPPPSAAPAMQVSLLHNHLLPPLLSSYFLHYCSTDSR